MRRGAATDEKKKVYRSLARCYAIDCGLCIGFFCLQGNMEKIPGSEAAGRKFSSIGFNGAVR